ncbi:DUF7289 family protein [Natronosalvus halobius]|uniref:DUF7289 family protein n=1 Tax=Natronosalvus halobius TaxID=2953746 RepID=UPI0020A0E1E7|nr:archaellin/type IV pilin N-terminal domain-containing protein [Natronosalvus halobius]USZ72677.1 hypothetical protein NGM15_05025 [Natronosalvus halobius]
MGRGQASIIGVVLLMGFVIISATAVAVMGSSALAVVQDQSNSEHRINEMQSLSQEMRTASMSNDGTLATDVGEFEFESGGNIQVLVDGEVVANHDMNRIVNGNLVYEGGLLIDGERVVDSPEMDSQDGVYRLTMPVVSGDSLNEELRHKTTRSVPITDSTANVTIVIESEYYEHWETLFEDADDIETIPEDNTLKVMFPGGKAPEPKTVENALSLGLANQQNVGLNDIPGLTADSYNSEVGSYDPANPNRNAKVAAHDDLDDNMGAGSQGILIRGDFVTSGNVKKNMRNGSHKNFEADNVYWDNDSIEKGIPTSELLDNPSDYSDEQLYVTGDLEGGKYYKKGLLVTSNEITVTDSSTLYVDGDLELSSSDIIVESGNELEVHVDGDLVLDDSSVINQDAHNSLDISFYVSGDVQIEPQENSRSELTGLLHASEGTLHMNDEVEIYGALAIDDIVTDNHNKDHLLIHYDENLENKVLKQVSETEMEEASRDTKFIEIRFSEFDSE